MTRQKELPTTKTASKVDVLKAYMQKYNTIDSDKILKNIMINGSIDELNEWRSLMPVFHSIKDKALKEIKLTKEIHGTAYVDKFLSECPSPEECMSVTETAKLFNDWCKEQRIDPGDLLMKTYSILDKSFQKCYREKVTLGKRFGPLH